MIIQVRCSGKLHRISYEGGSLRLLDHTGDAYRVLKVEEELQQLRNHPSTCRCAAVLRAWRTRDRYHSTSQLDWRHLDAATALVKRVGCSAELQATIAHAPTAALRKIRLRDVSRSWQQEIEQRDA